MMSVRRGVDELSDHHLWKLGRLLSSDDGGESYWRWLASELGLGSDDVEAFQSSPNAGYRVIKHWSCHNVDCSIGVLRNILGDVMHRTELVQLVDKARRS